MERKPPNHESRLINESRSKKLAISRANRMKPVDTDHLKQHTKQEFHELRMRPQRETLVPSRGLIQRIQEDPVCQDAVRELAVYPQVLYKLAKDSGFQAMRLKTAFVISLVKTQYFMVNTEGDYDPTHAGQQRRARAMLQSLVYGKKPIIEDYAGSYYRKYYPVHKQA